jgi:hypothetical protein
LNVERFTKAFVSGHVRKKWGKTKIKMALQRRGIPAEIIKNKLDGVEDENYQERLQKAAAQKWPRIKAANITLAQAQAVCLFNEQGLRNRADKKSNSRIKFEGVDQPGHATALAPLDSYGSLSASSFRGTKTPTP